ncbi:MAG: 5-(carboxyamino)imidazole ribonucleotide mutase [Lachnospiraceae bacterium]|nr:5-(carboxyamino)imidazole ribonucleotide mutase [Lachnospiraceae bacterium]
MKPVVGIVMGSDSDLPVMAKAAEFLDSIGVEYELTVISAHRTPDRFLEYMRSAKERGLKVIIGGAGGAAHLPGMAAALTPLPVIGVPIETKALGGVDSLYSIVQMPSGIPVATVAINGAANAAILAAKILAIGDEGLTGKLEDYAKSLAEKVEAKAEKIEKIKYKAYLEQM